MVSWSTVAVLALVCVVYGAFCTAMARAFFRARADRAAYRTAGAWAACFGATVIGSLMARDAQGVEAAAAFAACACLASFPLCLALERRWRNRDMAAAVAYLQLHRPALRPAEPAAVSGSEWGAGLDATCARLARTYDLTRREEDVLRLLAEGRTFAETADELVVSLNTVKSHARRIYAKMGVGGKADLLEKVSC
ncbi:helix-turn-helix transcriptional regulator [Paraeggerthella hongkongensis]|uniref:LuxR family transcriptional regulator n=1 Tax=Paraeggerthella hongkongensis TaxID=230658 RepID=A0A3N0BA23_9ACTN|nr:LuxR family transcriptional regulator [Paraeggerthella hongkongensis]RNL43857.1 LuxR family transcriptional regulator [Paraeggerthella hongkongensis]